ncbi:MAG TPA: MarR family transcriptional regulator [Flavobacteriia bacterium]|nr:MarR family transcriptional regulator [Flavobacteriia bacterium]
MEREHTIDHLLRATWQAVAKMYNEQAQKQNYTMSMGFVILNIDCENGTPSTALGPLMGMEATSLSRILKSMEEKGLIYREKNPNDGRGVLIKLTGLGKVKRKDAKESVLEFNEMVFNNVSKNDLDGFNNVINVINKLISDNKIYQNTNNKKVS